jgi:hypothetical protein
MHNSVLILIIVIAFPINAIAKRIVIPHAYDSLIVTACKLYSVDPAIVRALMYKESHMKPNAKSPKGALGLMQIMPATGKELGVASPADLLDPAMNIAAGVHYLSIQLKRFKDVDLAIASYNAGPNRVAKLGRIPNIKETKDYVRFVNQYLTQERADLAAAAALDVAEPQPMEVLAVEYIVQETRLGVVFLNKKLSELVELLRHEPVPVVAGVKKEEPIFCSFSGGCVASREELAALQERPPKPDPPVEPSKPNDKVPGRVFMEKLKKLLLTPGAGPNRTDEEI